MFFKSPFSLFDSTKIVKFWTTSINFFSLIKLGKKSILEFLINDLAVSWDFGDIIEPKIIWKNENNNDVIIYFFFTEWCPYCKKALPEWEKFTDYVNNINETNDYNVIKNLMLFQLCLRILIKIR